MARRKPMMGGMRGGMPMRGGPGMDRGGMINLNQQESFRWGVYLYCNRGFLYANRHGKRRGERWFPPSWRPSRWNGLERASRRQCAEESWRLGMSQIVSETNCFEAAKLRCICFAMHEAC